MGEKSYPQPTDAFLELGITGVAVTDVKEYQLGNGRRVVVVYRVNQTQGPQIREAIISGYSEPRNFVGQFLFGPRCIEIPSNERNHAESELKEILKERGVEVDRLLVEYPLD